MSNKPPYVSLELDKTEAKFLMKILDNHKAKSEEIFIEYCGMRSSDPRALNRATVTFSASAEANFSEILQKRFTHQQPKLKEFFSPSKLEPEAK